MLNVVRMGEYLSRNTHQLCGGGTKLFSRHSFK
jgi:hypothetical protein